MNNDAVTDDGAEENRALSSEWESGEIGVDDPPDLVCLSRLRWDFARQRPQHLMSRPARERRVFFVEEPVFGATIPRLDISNRDCGVFVVTPHLREGLDDAEAAEMEQSLLLDELFLERKVRDYILWYYTPMATAFTWRLDPLLVVYDCMDEPPDSKFAPPVARDREDELLKLADVVFTSGYGLYEAKRRLHRNVYPVPGGVDPEHFRKARREIAEPLDQARLGRPRLGFYGVIDERLNQGLLAGIADMRPDWQIVIIGPLDKIDPAQLPRRSNIHYLGGKNYEDMPAYLSGWDVAVAPFERDESTRYFNPVEPPECLAAGIPTISALIGDVEILYGRQGLVEIADTADEFVAAAERLINRGIDYDYDAWLNRVDEALALNTWDGVWARMRDLIDLTFKNRYSDMFATKRLTASASQSSGFTSSYPK